MNNINCNKIPLFKGWVLENFPFIEADFDAITNYQLISKVIEYLNKIINNENKQNLAINELKEQFIILKNYVDNLDLQEYVDDKLDEMAEDGTLQEIMASYLNSNALWCYDNINELKNATNLIIGSHVKTAGYYEVNDGGGSEYIIKESSTGYYETLENGLVAEIVINEKANVKQFGAYGDNEHNDTLAFQNAVSYYKNIYIPNGTYLLYDEIYITNDTSLIGESRDSILKFNTYEALEDNKFLINSSNISNIILKNLTITGLLSESSVTNAKYYGLRFYNGNNLMINNCVFKDFYQNGIAIRNSSDITIIDSLFENNKTNGVAFTQNIKNVNIFNNVFKNNTMHNINFEDNQSQYEAFNINIDNNTFSYDEYLTGTSHYAIAFIAPTLDDITKYKYHDIKITNNIIKNIAQGIVMRFSHDVLIDNNNIDNSYFAIRVAPDLTAGLTLDNYQYNINIINNTIKNNELSNSSIRLTGIKHSLFRNNKIKGSASTSSNQAVILCSNSDYLTIEDNYIYDTSNYGINLLSNNTNMFMYNNLFKDLRTLAVRITQGGDSYLHFDNNKYLDTGENMTYTLRFTQNIDYVIIERELENPTSLYYPTSYFGDHVVTRNNNGFTP